MAGFASTFGRDFYGCPAKEGDEVTLKRSVWKVPTGYEYERAGLGKEWIIPFMADEEMGWEIVKTE